MVGACKRKSFQCGGRKRVLTAPRQKVQTRLAHTLHHPSTHCQSFKAQGANITFEVFYPMNSPIEPVSPSPSSPSSDSPPPEDSQPELLSPPTSQQYSQGHSPSFAKRRLPSGAGPYNRDAKARKRDDRVGASTMSLKWSGSGYTQGDARESKKEELVDAEWMEKLKNGMLSAVFDGYMLRFCGDYRFW